MSYSPSCESAFNDSKLRSDKVTPCSGMCSLCAEGCMGTCEIGLSAILGEAMVYPTNTGANQVAGEKNHPIDYSIFNINGRCFGAVGAEETSEAATIFNVKLDRKFGSKNKVKVNVPFNLPALIKLNWKDYFAAAAMIGTVCVIGEGAPSKDPDLVMENGKIKKFEKLKEMLDAFNKYDRGYGQIVLQCNVDDDMQGLPEYAIKECGCKAIEFKFGQSAKGTQPANRLKNIEEALKEKANGILVHPDPEDPEVIKNVENGCSPVFWKYGRLPMWTEEKLVARINELRAMGLKNVYFKMAGFDTQDMEKVLRIASAAEVDMVTYDGAGGGSGYSPSKMMNEFGYSAVQIESALVPMCKKLEAEGKYIPYISLTGGFTDEGQAYKALAIGAPYIKSIGLCRATMAAAMVGDTVGKQLAEGKVPAHLAKYGNSADEIFLYKGELQAMYPGKELPLGAVGAYSYLRKMAYGVQHFAALNRKFNVDLIGQEDVIPLNDEARRLLEQE